MIIWEGNFNVDSDTIESISSELKMIPKAVFGSGSLFFVPFEKCKKDQISFLMTYMDKLLKCV